MAKEDILLRVEMGKLEIEPNKINKSIKFINNAPQSKKFNIGKNLQNYKCSCISQKKNKSITICKKKHKIIREPILKLSSSYSKVDYRYINTSTDMSQPVINPGASSESVSLHTLVDNCNQLSISSDVNRQNTTSAQLNDDTEWWRNNLTKHKQAKDFYSEKGQSSTCSQQALNPPCDVTIDELASYFETLVHIPKKMSSMAEMMYI